MLYANTDDGSSAQWVCDGNGIVVDNISIYGAERAPILEEINEHYGTSFTGWSDNEIGLRFGDPLPDWDAYEKIELLDDKIKLKMTDNMWSFASIRNNTVYVAASDEHSFFVVNNNGEISQSLGGIENLIERNWVPKLSEAGFNYEVSQEIVDYEIGQSLDNWNRYISI